MHTSEELDVSLALKAIARNTSLKSALLQMPTVYSALWPAARRFVTGETRQVGTETAKDLASLDYGIFPWHMLEKTQELSRHVKLHWRNFLL